MHSYSTNRCVCVGGGACRLYSTVLDPLHILLHEVVFAPGVVWGRGGGARLSCGGLTHSCSTNRWGAPLFG
jgi:hypothetical protein